METNMYCRSMWKTLGIVAVAVAAVASWPHAAGARGQHARNADPLAAAQHQQQKSEQTHLKHRRQMDIEGAEIRDQKKSAEDSKQSQMQSELGTPEPDQSNRWSVFGR